MHLSFIPFTLLIVPIVEIAVFILIGNQIGLWPTLGMIVVTALIGTILLRHQGFRLLTEIRTKMEANEIPGRALIHGVMLLIAGVLLLTPGFVTDTIGFLLFIPPVRDAIWGFLKERINFAVVSADTMRGSGSGFGSEPLSENSQGPTIDLDETEFGPADPDSPWNKK